MKKILLISVAICLIIISSPVLATPTIEVIPERLVVESGDVVDFEILVHNDLDNEIEFGFNVLGPHLTWIQPPESMIVDAFGSKTTTVTLEPTGEN